MKIEAGMYYRHLVTRKVVKVLHPEVWPAKTWAGSPPHSAHVIYRQNDDAFPHRFEFIERWRFTEFYEGPLDWDAAIPGWKGQK